MKIDPHKPYCVYMHVYENGSTFMGVGKYAFAIAPKNMEGYEFIILGDYKTKKAAERAMGAREEFSSISYAVRCEQTGFVYRSQADAAKACGVHPSTLSSHILRCSPETVNGFTFVRADGYAGPFMQPEELPRHDRKSRAVRCLTTNGYFRTQSAAAAACAINQATLSAHLNKRDGYEAPYGLKFEYVQGYDGPYSDMRDNLLMLATDQKFPDGRCGLLSDIDREVLSTATVRKLPTLRDRRGNLMRGKHREV